MESSQKNQQHILLVDDSATGRYVIRQNLEAMDYLVTEAENGDIALEKLKASPPDLVLCDLVMPGLDGLQVMARARELYPNIPFLLLTMYSSTDHVIEALRAGADDFITKPVEVSILSQRIKAALSRGQLLKEQEEKARLEAALATAGAAAHEINQPLTALLASAELLAHMDEPERIQEHAVMVAKEAERMGRIVHRLLNIMRYRTTTYLGETEILDLKASSKS